MLEPAIADDHVRHLARSVKLCYTRQNALVLPPVPITSRKDTGAFSVSHNLDNPQQCSAILPSITMLGVTA